MDRQSIAQAVATLVVLAALVRWLPGAGPGDLLGRGDPYKLVSVVAMVAHEPDSPAAVGRLRNSLGTGSEQAALNIAHWTHLTERVRELRERATPGQSVQLRHFARNDLWMLVYDLYPLRVLGRSLEDGSQRDEAVDPQADWVLTGCALRPRQRCLLQSAAEARGDGP